MGQDIIYFSSDKPVHHQPVFQRPSLQYNIEIVMIIPRPSIDQGKQAEPNSENGL